MKTKMDVRQMITAGLFNFNGDRNKIDGKGRLQTTLESLFRSIPIIGSIRFILLDNQSEDSSGRFLADYHYGEKYVLPHIEDKVRWRSVTLNNLTNLKQVISMTNTPYYWNIENDSFFFNPNFDICKAINILETNPDIAIIHLRRWTPLDCIDKPGAPQNHCRVEEIRELEEGAIYVLERTPQDCVWVDVEETLKSDFMPYSADDDFKSLRLGSEPGCIRKKDGKWQRLIEDHYNTYTTHGYIVRTDCLKFILEKYNPQSEKETSIAFKKHFKAARMDMDAFVCFGWNTRINPSEEEIKKMFRWAMSHNYSSVLDYGTFRGTRIKRGM